MFGKRKRWDGRRQEREERKGDGDRSGGEGRAKEMEKVEERRWREER